MNASDDLLILIRVLGGLAVVIVLVLLTARVARRSRGRHGIGGLRVVERVALTRDAQVAVVEVHGRTMLLGVTAQGVTMLSGLDAAPRTQAPLHVVLETGRAPAQVDPIVDETPPAAPQARPAGRRAADAREPEAPGRAARPARPAERQSHDRRENVQMPDGLDLEGFSDLASALRAAGRTAEAGEQPEPGRQRRQAGQPGQARKAAPSRQSGQARQAGQGREAAPQPGQRTGRRRADAPAAGAAPRVPQQRPQQTSGSPLSPATWRQGIDALRDYTARRG